MRALSLAAATLLAIASQSALGATIRVSFAGSVESISGYNFTPGTAPIPISPAEAQAALGGSIQIGTRFSGSVEYDDADVPSDGQSEGGANPNWSLFYFPSPYYPDGSLHSPPIGPDAAVQGEIGQFVGGGPQQSGLIMEVFDNELYLANAAPSEVMFEGGFSHAPTTPNDPLVMDGVIVRAIGGAPGSPLHSTSLEGIPWSLENFPATNAQWSFTNGLTSVSVVGNVDYLVPEPARAALVALAACAMLAARKRIGVGFE
jgi:hypothetical protein